MKKLLFLLLISATFLSCNLIKEATKSPGQIASILDVQTSSDLLYESIIQGDKGYESHSLDYNTIKSKVDGVVSYNKNRKNAVMIYKQSLLLQKYFDKYMKDHEVKGVLPISEARTYKMYIKSLIRPLMESELSLKN